MKRTLYFGTNGSRPGHMSIPIYGKFSWEEKEKIEMLVDCLDFQNLFLDGSRSKWFNLKFELDKKYQFLGYAVPYSPDDKRGYSKTVILVEDGTMEDIEDVLASHEFVRDQFNKVWEEYNYSKEERV